MSCQRAVSVPPAGYLRIHGHPGPNATESSGSAGRSGHRLPVEDKRNLDVEHSNAQPRLANDRISERSVTLGKAYKEELVYTHTSEDGVMLSGILTSPETARAKGIAIVFIHGRPVSGFIPMMTGHAREIANRGYSVLTGNTRGHDIGTWLFRQIGRAHV